MDHHAYVYEADTLGAANLPEAVLVPGVDVEHFIADRLSIDDARRLKLSAETRPVSRPVRSFVLVARSMTVEAQNALLKLFEEPPLGAEFHLVVPQVAVLVPTLRSRVHLVQRARVAHDLESPEFAHFKTLTFGERLEYVARIVKEKDLDAQEAFLRAIEHHAHGGLPNTQALLREVVVARTYLESAGASRKMILESLALSLDS